MSTTEQVGTVAAGRYLIEVGRSPGLALERRPAEADDARVADALAHRDDRRQAPAGAGPLDAAAEATARCEEAADLFGAVVRGELLDPEHVGARLDVMLELVQRLDRDGDHEQALQLARAVAKVLALLARWRQFARTLGVARHAAAELGDGAWRGWVEHELGTLELVAGRVRHAEEHLSAARTLRLRDRRALALTERNLQALCGRLRELAREGALERRRPPRAVLAALAALLLLLGGVAGSVVAEDDPPVLEAAAATPPAPTPGASATPTATAAAEVTLEVRRKGEGRVTGLGLDCGDDCRTRRPAGSTATLRAEPDPGWRFDGWRGVRCDAPACDVELDGDLTVTAVFAMEAVPTPVPPVPMPGPDPLPVPEPIPPADPKSGPMPAPDPAPAPDAVPGPMPLPPLPDSGTVPASQ